MRFTARPSSRSQDTPGRECGAGLVGAAGGLWGVVAVAICSPAPLPCRKHCARGWSFLSLLTGYVPPSATLMPYVTKFLQDSSLSQGACGGGVRGFSWGPAAGGRVWRCS